MNVLFIITLCTEGVFLHNKYFLVLWVHFADDTFVFLLNGNILKAGRLLVMEYFQTSVNILLKEPKGFHHCIYFHVIIDVIFTRFTFFSSDLQGAPYRLHPVYFSFQLLLLDYTNHTLSWPINRININIKAHKQQPKCISSEL